MMNKRLFLICLLALGVLLAARLPARAQDTGLVERFDDPGLPGWEVAPSVAVVDGSLTVPSGGFAYHPAPCAPDVTIILRARRAGPGPLQLEYCSGDEAAYHLRFDDARTALVRHETGGDAELAAAPISMPADAWVNVRIEVGGGDHVVSLDGVVVLSAHDANPLLRGGVLLRSLGETAGSFDDIEVRAGGQAPVVPIPAGLPANYVPAYQAGSWVRTGGPIGGLGYDIRYNFSNPHEWYVTDAWSGFHLSVDNGLTWTPSNTGIISRKPVDAIAIFSATVDPHDPNIIWIGTELSGDIYRSTDAGRTWIELDNGVDPELRPLSFRGFTVDPRTSDIVYAMGEIGSPGWTPDQSPRRGLEMDMTQGIVYKTTDGGQTWHEIWRGDNLARYCWIDPRNPDVLYVSTGIFDREAANTDVAGGHAGGVGVLKSTDGGQSWRVLNQANGLLDLYVGSLYMHPENPDMLLAAAAQNNWSLYGDEFTGGVFLTEDGGENWQRVLDYTELYSVVEYCPSDPAFAYAASADAVYRSEDAGHTWQRFSRPNGTWGPDGIVAGFPIDMQCDPRDPMRVIVNNYLGGNFLSVDGGQSWVLASQGYTGELVNRVVVAPGAPLTVFVGSRSGIYRSDDGGDDWRGLVNPLDDYGAKFNEIVTLAVDPVDPEHLITRGGDSGYILHSYDGGQSWEIGAELGRVNQLTFAGPSTLYAITVAGFCVDGTIPPTPVDCAQPDFGLSVSRDAGQPWSRLTSPSVSGVALIALAFVPAQPEILYVSSLQDGLLKSVDGGQTWSSLANGPPDLPAYALAIDPSNPAVLYAGFGPQPGSMGGGGLYRSADAGQSWTQASAGLPPEALVNSIVVDPVDGKVVYAGDKFSGIYLSTDGGATWQAMFDGLLHRTVNTLAISDDGTVLYAGIWGDGVYRLGPAEGS